MDYEAEEDFCWKLLHDLKPASEKQAPVEEYSEHNEQKCEHCHSSELIVQEGQYVCRHCNVIQSRVIDDGAEWRFYGVDDNRSDDPTRCGMPTNNLLPKSSMGSMIGYYKYSKDNRDIGRIRRYLIWNSMPHWERTLYQIFEQLNNTGNTNGIPVKVIDDSKVFFKRASEMKISRGDNKDGLIASCLYYACLINKVPRSTKEIARMFKIDHDILTKGNARFQELLKVNVEASNADDFISRFGSNLNMNWEDIDQCRELTKKIEDMEVVSENAPTSVAASAIYFYSFYKELEISKKYISETCDVSEVTITKCFKKLQKYKDLLIVSS
jgi:transcription initiation factor TFIIIB Brf1 subunit/transcription initiation factor TFIIB